MYRVAIFSVDDQLVQKISRSVEFLDCHVFRFPTLLSNHQAGFLQNFDLVFVHKDKHTLDVNHFIDKTTDDHQPALTVALLPDSQLQMAGPLLDMGYDRCLSESFAEEHLAAMVRALLRRRLGVCSTISFYGELEFNHLTKQSFLKSTALPLPVREAQILGLLLRKVGQIVPTEEFLAEIDPLPNRMNKSTIHAYIHKLKNRISSNVLPIRNIKRNGYFLKKYSHHAHSSDASKIFPNLYG